MRDADNLKRTTLEKKFGTIITDNVCEQARSPTTQTGIEVRQTFDLMKTGYVGSVLQADALVEKITIAKKTNNQIFKETVEELNNLKITQYIPFNIQEALDDAAFSDLLGYHISNREKARLISIRSLTFCTSDS